MLRCVQAGTYKTITGWL